MIFLFKNRVYFEDLGLIEYLGVVIEMMIRGVGIRDFGIFDKVENFSR